MDLKRLDATQAGVLGSLLIDPSLAGEIFSRCREEDFTIPAYRSLFQAAQTLFSEGRPIDTVTLCATAGKEYNDLVLQIMAVNPTAAYWEEYCRLLRESSMLYRAQKIGQTLGEADSLEAAQAQMEKLSQILAGRSRRRIVGLVQGLADFVQRQQQEVSYLSWPFPELRSRMFTSAGDFVVLGGRPSAGKTALALNCAWHMSATQRVGFFSLETGDAKIFDRFFANVGDMDFNKIKRHELSMLDIDDFSKRTADLYGRTMEIIPASHMTVQEIQSITLGQRYSVIFVDYLQLVDAPGYNRTEQVANISLGLHRLAQDHGVTVIALAQLNRPENEATAPGLASLKESGQIEQDADAVMFLYLTNPKDATSSRQLLVAKNKEGKLGKFALAFDGSKQRFSSLRSTNNWLEDAQEDPESIIELNPHRSSAGMRTSRRA